MGLIINEIELNEWKQWTAGQLLMSWCPPNFFLSTSLKVALLYAMSTRLCKSHCRRRNDDDIHCSDTVLTLSVCDTVSHVMVYSISRERKANECTHFRLLDCP
jgi:uncharacterized protein involved in response to NO